MGLRQAVPVREASDLSAVLVDHPAAITVQFNLAYRPVSPCRFLPCHGGALRELFDSNESQPKQLEQIRQPTLIRNYAIRADAVYGEWVKRWIHLHC